MIVVVVAVVVIVVADAHNGRARESAQLSRAPL